MALPRGDSLQLIESYITVIITEKGLSKNTAAAYGRDLRAFTAYLTEHNLDLLKLNPNNLREYTLSLRLRGLKSRSCSRAVISLRGFYKYLIK